jgi:chemotaxis protein MotA
MDISSIGGIGLAFIAIFAAQFMEGGSPSSLFLVPPLVLVFGGTIGAAMAGGVLKDTTGMIGALKKAMTAKPQNAGGLVDTMVKMAERARREGLLALEEAAKEIQDPFLRRGLELAIDGTDPEELSEILHAEVAAKKKADKTAAKIFADMGGYAPTIGIIGTVLGLIHVLANLSEPSELGKLIASAFVATLWGVLTANVIWLPIGNRLNRISGLECEQMELAIEGVMAIQAGSNPRLVAQRLRSLLPPESGAPKEKAKAA